MGKESDTYAGSRFTGRFWTCNFNATHHPVPVALPIKKGAVRYFLPQCICGGNGRAGLMPQDWNDNMGMTAEQARAKGYMLLAVVRRPSAMPTPTSRGK